MLTVAQLGTGQSSDIRARASSEVKAIQKSPIELRKAVLLQRDSFNSPDPFRRTSEFVRLAMF